MLRLSQSFRSSPSLYGLMANLRHPKSNQYQGALANSTGIRFNATSRPRSIHLRQNISRAYYRKAEPFRLKSVHLSHHASPPRHNKGKGQEFVIRDWPFPDLCRLRWTPSLGYCAGLALGAWHHRAWVNLVVSDTRHLGHSVTMPSPLNS